MSPNSKSIQLYKAFFPIILPVNIFSLLLGHILGDCTIKYNAVKDSASFAFEWGNKTYAYYVYNMNIVQIHTIRIQ